MARNPNVTKMKRQKFQRRRGTFKPLSDASSLDETFVHNDLRQFWSEKVSPRHKQNSSVNNKAHVPEDKLGYFDYRGHAKYRPERVHTLDGETPHGAFWLSRLFPDAKFITNEREAVLAARDVLRQRNVVYETGDNGAIVERSIEVVADPDMYFAIWTTEHAYLRVYFLPSKNCWWFVERNKRVIKASITFSNKKRAFAAYETGAVRWHVIRTVNPDSS